MVTKHLEKAFDQASTLPASEQEQLASWILEELKTERKWSRSFTTSSEKLVSLAEEALREHAAGESEELDSDKP
jgi:hypothetical protein